jgi:ferric-dicitrate binding protein FerR (iron transport regulator)
MIENQLLQKYFEGKCTQEELQVVLQWLNDDKADHELLRVMMMRRWDNLFEAEKEEEEKAEPAPVLRLRRSFLRYAIAASVAGVLMVGAWLFNDYRVRSLAASWRSLANTSTKMKFCLLPDSTSVWLDPKSTLWWRMPLAAGEARSIRVEGQAFFDVARDKDRPFVVYSGALVTRVLGTAFNIEAYREEKNIRISLINGKVAIQQWTPAGLPAEVLKPGEVLNYEKETATTRKMPLKMTDLSDWTSGHLVFNEVPVQTALERLATLYHFDLRYRKDVHLENDRFSTVFTKEETPVQMIRNILFITPYTYRLIGNNEVEIIHK